MPILTYKDRVKQAVTVGGVGALTLGAASTGFQALGAAENSKRIPYSILDTNAWETGYGIYNHSTLSFTRSERTDSSTGAAIDVSTSAKFAVDVIAAALNSKFVNVTGDRLLNNGDIDAEISNSSGLYTLTIPVVDSSFAPVLRDIIKFAPIGTGQLILEADTGVVLEDPLQLGTGILTDSYSAIRYQSLNKWSRIC